MGDTDQPMKTVLAQASEAAVEADAVDGRVHVRWDERAQATPHGQIVAINAQHDSAAMVPFSRCDGENGCDPWKNPWGRREASPRKTCTAASSPLEP